MVAGATNCSHQPVRRHSRRAGSCEAIFWRSFDPRDVGRYMLAAERFERTRREKGKRVGPLGSVALEVLRELLRLVDYKTGRLDPSLETLMRRCRRSKDAVVRALANLRRHGFLDWLRRYRPTDNDGFGPQVVQTTNAYRVLLPPAAARLLGAIGAAPPPPDDAQQRREDHDQDVQGMLKTLPGDERISATTASPVVEQALLGLWRAMSRKPRAT